MMYCLETEIFLACQNSLIQLISGSPSVISTEIYQSNWAHWMNYACSIMGK